MAQAKKKSNPSKAAKKRSSLQKAKAADKRKIEAKAKDTAVLKKLAPIATEINVRMEKAAKSDTLAIDHRLAAALRLAEVKAALDAQGIRFKTWCESNIKQSYHTARGLAAIGASDDPRLMLTDKRAGNKERAAKTRAAGDGGSAGSPLSQVAGPAGAGPQPKSAIDTATAAVAALGDKGALNLAIDVAADSGMKVVTEAAMAELGMFRKQAKEGPGLAAVKSAFDALKPADKMVMAEYAAKKCGCTITEPTYEDPLALPKGLDRSVKRGAKK